MEQYKYKQKKKKNKFSPYGTKFQNNFLNNIDFILTNHINNNTAIESVHKLFYRYQRVDKKMKFVFH
jgi:hypothetical protein